MTEETPSPTVPSRLQDCSPAQKLVYYALADHEPATQRQLHADTQLPVRTVRAALKDLEDQDEVEWTSATGDSRKKWYKRVRNG